MCIGDSMNIIWALIIILLIALEFITVEFIAFWYVLSAIISYIISFFSGNFLLQFLIFIVFGTLFMLIFKDKTIAFLKKNKVITTSDKLIGELGIVTKTISKKQFGEVKVNKKKWTAYSDENIGKGTKVRILSVSGVKLKVETNK